MSQSWKNALQIDGRTDKAEFIGPYPVWEGALAVKQNYLVEYDLIKAFGIYTERTKKVRFVFLLMLAQKQKHYICGLIKKRISKQIKIGEKDVLYSSNRVHNQKSNHRWKDGRKFSRNRQNFHNSMDKKLH